VAAAQDRFRISTRGLLEFVTQTVIVAILGEHVFGHPGVAVEPADIASANIATLMPVAIYRAERQNVGN
jgi:hypothetical protein